MGSAELLEGSKHRFRRPLGEATALVLNIDQDAIVLRMGGKRNTPVRPRELDGILEQVCQRGCEDLSVAFNHQAVIDRGDDELEIAGRCLQRGGNLHVPDELCDVDALPSLGDPARQPYLDEGPVDEVAQSDEAAIEQGAGGPRDPDGALFDRRDAQDRVPDQLRSSCAR